ATCRSRPSVFNAAIESAINPSPHALSRGKPLRSHSTTRRPARASRKAAAAPAGPAPATTTSALIGDKAFSFAWVLTVMNEQTGESESAERSGASGGPASDAVGGSAGAKPPGLDQT